MQPLPFISSDLFVSGPAASMPSATTGSEGDFASALAAAANGQQGNGAQTAARGAGKDGSLPGQHPARLDGAETPGEFADADQQELDTYLNGAAGAANLVMHFTRELPEQSAVSQMLSAITMTGNEATAGDLLAGASTRGGEFVLSGMDVEQTATQPAQTTLQTMAPPVQQTQVATPQTVVATAMTGKVAEAAISVNAETIKPATNDAGKTTNNVTVLTATILPTAEPAASRQAATPQDAKVFVQNETSQVVVTSQAAMDEQAPQAATTGVGSVTGSETTGIRQEINGDFIRSNLPNSIADAAQDDNSSQQQAASPQGAKVFVQNETSQVVVTSQTAVDEQAPQAATARSGAITGSETTGIRQEINGDFIRSNLPNSIAGTAQDDNSNQQQDQAGDKGQSSGSSANSAGQSLGEQMLAQRAQVTATQDSQPLIFAHQLGSSLSAATGSTAQASTDPSMVRLPSGTMVPEGSAMDQMIAHFSMNKRLETSTVNLRLHPQDLGELRMEIKVEQDNIKAHIIAQNPHAQEMIDRHLPRLREALEQQGLHLAQVEVTLAANDRTDSQAFQDNLSQNLMNRTLKNKSTQPAFPLSAGEETEEAVQAPISLSVMA